MQIKCRTCILLTLGVAFSWGEFFTKPDENTLWLENFKSIEINDGRRNGWRNCNPDEVGVEQLTDGARLREIGPKSYHYLTRYVPVDFIACVSHFLHIRIGAVENPLKPAIISFVSENGYPCGSIRTAGTITIPLRILQTRLIPGAVDAALTVVVIGSDGTQPGPYTVVESMSLRKAPAGGLVMELQEVGDPDYTAQVGEKIWMCYFNESEKKLKTLTITFICYGDETPFHFNNNADITLQDDGENGDAEAGDGVLSALVLIDSDADRYVKPCGGGEIAVTTAINGRRLFVWLAFNFNLDTTNRTAEILKASTPQARAGRREWLSLTAGRENLALGKLCRFSPAPDYPLTTDKCDETDLTDGAFAPTDNDRIWTVSNSVGFMRGTTGVNIMIDLGSIQPVERIVARTIGGLEQPILPFPREFHLLVSDDRHDWYEIAQLQKLNPTERDFEGRSGVFRLPEEGVAYACPIAFTNLQIAASYVGLRVISEKNFLYFDESGVFKENVNPAIFSFKGRGKTPFYIDGVVFTTKKGHLAVCTNLSIPSFFMFYECRKIADQKNPVTFCLDLPRGIELMTSASSGNLTSNMTNIDGKTYTHWVSSNLTIKMVLETGPLYLSAARGAHVSSNLSAFVYAQSSGYAPNRIELPIMPFAVPLVPPIDRFHISLCWMYEMYYTNWPDFMNSYRLLGFNHVPAFPAFWDLSNAAFYQTFLAEARQKGFKILYNESLFHRMVKNHSADLKIYSQLEKPSKHPCPAYRGQWYREEIKRVGDMVALCDPDFVLYDIELWYEGIADASTCLQCREYKKERKASNADFFGLLGTEMMKDLMDEVRDRLRRTPSASLYNTYPSRPVYDVFDFSKLYPGIMTMAQPSLYVKGDCQYIRKVIRDNYTLMKSRNIMPLLTTGCYGEFEPFKVELQIYETMLNGAGGFTYFAFWDFDTPLDYYYHAKALANLAPYQKLVGDGKPFAVVSLNSNVSISALSDGRAIIVLAVNYATTSAESFTLKLPFSKVTKLRILSENRGIVPAPSVNATLSNYQFVLWYAAEI